MSSIPPLLASIRSPFLRKALEDIGEALPSFSWDVVKLVAHYWGGSLRICGRDAVKKNRGFDIGEDPEITWKHLEDCHLKGIKLAFRVPKSITYEGGCRATCTLRTFGTKFQSDGEAVQAIVDTPVRDAEAGFWGLGDVLSIGKDFKEGKKAVCDAGCDVAEAHILAIGVDCRIIEMQCNPEAAAKDRWLSSWSLTNLITCHGHRVRRIIVEISGEDTSPLHGVSVTPEFGDYRTLFTGVACLLKLE